jgi:hypothetical protein
MLFDKRRATKGITPKNNPFRLTGQGSKFGGIHPVNWLVFHVENREPPVSDRGFAAPAADPIL